MPDLRSTLRDAGDPTPPPTADLATLHARARRLRRRRAVAATMAVALVTIGAASTAQSLLNRAERQVEFIARQPPSASPDVATDSPSSSPSPSPDSGTDATPDPGTDASPAGPVIVATSHDGQWRLVVGRQHGGLCAQLVPIGDEFDRTFCGASEVVLDDDGVAAGFGGAEGSPDAFSYGMTDPDAVTVRVDLDDDRTLSGDTIASADFPNVRFFLMQLPPPFAGVDSVTAIDGAGKRVGYVDLRGHDDV